MRWRADIRAAIAGQGFEELPIGVGDAERAGRLTRPHRDPFDRMLIAQAGVRCHSRICFLSYLVTVSLKDLSTPAERDAP